MKMARDKFQSQSNVYHEQLELIQASYDELASKKQTETEILSKEVNLIAVREKEIKNKLMFVERELGETKDVLRNIA
eukprot:CAMPEP_0176347286 /NCGR_PEP_ID=MMETSP0126-20121128/6928_1 /TAXON_ID=141414 ORGANISM="Strombidinopsis acuminatum, Strain SPMC142" /NCGR_SAMPLE_ID=MMETSP0126 /ASSEMBLY_ACC=CAM_ASM_000229 /LENGTH=76 /DNA_ID=CAMNT_0017695355 /DNA_START=792 /DNA_END=1022 /DNA_ORIENTATION=-